jgi:hypothetical protein
MVKSVLLILGGERREENLEKDIVASLQEYELDIGDMEKITEKSKQCFSHGFTVPEETKSKPPLLAVLAIARLLQERLLIFFLLPQRIEVQH